MEAQFTGVGSRERPAAFHFGSEKWRHAHLAYVHTWRVDPLQAWLEDLPPWDGVERLDAMLHKTLGAGIDDPLARWASAYLCCGVVWRTYKPGYKLDVTPVLWGSSQGTAKTTLLEWLLPEMTGQPLYGTIRLSDSNKEKLEGMQGRALLEFSEMSGSTKAELENMKAFLSSRWDSVRLSYRRNSETMYWRCIFAATTNRQGSLPNDPTGNRRWAVIPTPGSLGYKGVIAWLDEHRRQLWAEALTRYHDGISPHMPTELEAIQAERNEQHRDRDDLLEGAIETLPTTGDGLTMESIVRHIEHVGVGRVSPRAVSAMLDARGWEQRRERQGGAQVRIWYQPVKTDPESDPI